MNVYGMVVKKKELNTVKNVEIIIVENIFTNVITNQERVFMLENTEDSMNEAKQEFENTCKEILELRKIVNNKNKQLSEEEKTERESDFDVFRGILNSNDIWYYNQVVNADRISFDVHSVDNLHEEFLTEIAKEGFAIIMMNDNIAKGIVTITVKRVNDL